VRVQQRALGRLERHVRQELGLQELGHDREHALWDIRTAANVVKWVGGLVCLGLHNVLGYALPKWGLVVPVTLFFLFELFYEFFKNKKYDFRRKRCMKIYPRAIA
jgi:hypothetical protein